MATNALFVAIIGCTSPAPGVGQTNSEADPPLTVPASGRTVPTRPKAVVERRKQEKDVPNQHLTADNFLPSVDHDQFPFVRVKANGDKIESFEALQKSVPNLVDVLRTQPHGAAMLAQFYSHLELQNSLELFASGDAAKVWWSAELEPTDVLEREMYLFTAQPSAPDFDRIKAPYFEGNSLVFFAGRMIGENHGSQVWEYRIDLSSTPWTSTREELPALMRERPALSQKAAELFGGAVEGYARGVGKNGSVYLTVKPDEKAAKFVWRPNLGNAEKFSSWAELARKYPEVNDTKTVASLAAGMSNYPVGRSYDVIHDLGVFKAEYMKSGRGYQKLRYWGDEIRETAFTVDWDKVHDARVVDDTITAFFSMGNGQPHRLEMTFSKFSESGWPEAFEPFFTSKVIYDSKDGPAAPAPDPIGD